MSRQQNETEETFRFSFTINNANNKAGFFQLTLLEARRFVDLTEGKSHHDDPLFGHYLPFSHRCRIVLFEKAWISRSTMSTFTTSRKIWR